MAGGTSTSGLGLNRLQAMKKVLIHLSETMGNTSSQEVLKNFIKALETASPKLKLAIFFITPWAMLMAAFAKYTWISRTLAGIKDYLVKNWIYASVSIPGTHPLNKQVLAYMTDRGLGKNARTLAVATPQSVIKSHSMYMDPGYDPYGSRRPKKQLTNPEDEEREKNAVSYIPEVGSYVFYWKWHRMTFERKEGLQEQVDSKGRISRIKQSSISGSNETIVISCPSLFAGPKPIQDFLNHVKSAPVKDQMTTIYRPENTGWDQGITRPSRGLNAVTLDAKIKDDLVHDMENYLDPRSRVWYANRGIPWRRGFLFYGQPGTGKTSFTTAIAGHFNLNVYMLSLSTNTLTDKLLEDLFEMLPSKCIVLLEDIDSAGVKRENMRQEKPPKKKSKKGRTPLMYDNYGRPMYMDANGEYHHAGPQTGGVTLAGLLNVLDGIRSKEGIVTIMTTNSPDSLDPALIRPGRIDRKVLFGYASKEVIAKLFVHIFEKAPEEMAEGETARADHDIPALAEDFASKIPADKLTPAEVQGYLLVHREDPVAAVDEAEEWAKKTLETKATGANVEAFADEGKLQNPKRSKKVDSHPAPPFSSYPVPRADEDDYVDDDGDDNVMPPLAGYDAFDDQETGTSSSASEEEWNDAEHKHSIPGMMLGNPVPAAVAANLARMSHGIDFSNLQTPMHPFGHTVMPPLPIPAERLEAMMRGAGISFEGYVPSPPTPPMSRAPSAGPLKPMPLPSGSLDPKAAEFEKKNKN